MRFILSTGSLWSYSLERVFGFAAKAGFDGLELMVDLRWETRQSLYLKKLMDQHQVPILAVHSPFLPNIPGWPHTHPERISCSADLAADIGAEVVIHHLPTRFGTIWVQMPGRFFPVPIPRNQDAGYRRWLDKGYQEFQATTSIKLCIENMPAYHRLGRLWNLWHWNTIEQIARFPNLTMDTTHLGTWGVDPAEIYPKWAGKVGHIHLSNFDGREHIRPENGRLHLNKLLSHLAKTNYTGLISLELQPGDLGAGQPDQAIIDRLKTSLTYCQNWA
ncbi:MAG: sugar phosphate isomerase/epimerase, partial [Candidatus Promineifilaceae bacterium]